MAKTDTNWWMNAAQLRKYESLTTKLVKLEQERQKLLPKLRARTINVKEFQKLVSLNASITEVFRERKALEDENPLKAENVLKSLKQRDS